MMRKMIQIFPVETCSDKTLYCDSADQMSSFPLTSSFLVGKIMSGGIL